MKRSGVFFHTFRLPSLRRLFLPILLLSIFSIGAFSMFEYRQVSSLAAQSPVVMIDPGHGGYDPGVKLKNLTEANLMLAISQKLQAELQKRGVQAVLTRETDTDFAEEGMRGKTAKRADLGKRIELTNSKNASLFISLHANMSQAATRGGSEVFYNEQVPGAKELAEQVQTQLHQLPNMSKRFAKSADYYLLRNQKIPALIIECGYLNIPAERARLTNPSYQQQLAAAIAQGVVDYLKSSK